MTNKIQVIDEETYLAIHGAGRGEIGESALHMNRTKSENTWKKYVEAQAEKDREILAKRSKLRKEYQEKVKNGELRPPTRLESLIATAKGHPDNQAVQASRRILKRRLGLDIVGEQG